MEKHDQNNPQPPNYSPPGVESGPETTVMDTTAVPQQPPDLTDHAVPVGAPPAKAIPVQAAAPRVTPLEHLNTVPQLVDCHFCQHRVMTRVQEENSTQTSIAAIFCCLFCGLIGACVPYMCKWAQDYHHFCTNCGRKIAIRPNDGPVQVQYPRGPASMPSVYPPAPTKPAPVAYR